MAGFRLVREDTAFAVDAPRGQRRPRREADTHLRFIRSLPCLVTGKRGVEACHVRFGDMRYGKRETGMQEKPHDMWTVPLCPEEHRKQHSMNERDYWTLAGINPITVASALWMNTGDDEACEQIIREAKKP